MASEIVVYHVGGGDSSIGPIEQVRKSGFPLEVITFEALDGKCLSDAEGEADFYVNKSPLSSGLLPPNPRYKDETASTMSGSWGAETTLERQIRVRTTTIDALRPSYQRPDVLSLDVQGAELRVMRGAAETLRETLCVVSEVEFSPIYEGQPLFGDQAAFLAPYGFRLMEFFYVQSWHPGERFGLGFITVAEAVWLRFDYETLPRERVERLAMIAAGFGRMSYVLRLLEHLNGEVENQLLRDLWRFRDNAELRKISPEDNDRRYPR